MSDSLCFDSCSPIDIYESSPLFEDVDRTDPWIAFKAHYAPLVKGGSRGGYIDVNPRAKRWSSDSESTSSSVSSSPTIACPERSNRRSSIIYKLSDDEKDRKQRARSSIVYKRSIPDASAPSPLLPTSVSSSSTSTPAARNTISSAALTAWAWTIGSVVSRRRMAARRRSLQLKPLQLASQQQNISDRLRAGFGWRLIAAHIAQPKKGRPLSTAQLKPLVLPSTQPVVECPPAGASLWLACLVQKLLSRGMGSTARMVQTLWFSVSLTSQYIFRFSKLLFTLFSYIVLACFRRFLPPRIL